MTDKIDIRKLSRGINARKGNVSVTTPSSMPSSYILETPRAFQEDAFQDNAFE